MIVIGAHRAQIRLHYTRDVRVWRHTQFLVLVPGTHRKVERQLSLTLSLALPLPLAPRQRNTSANNAVH